MTLVVLLAVGNRSARADPDAVDPVLGDKTLSQWIKALQDEKPQRRMQAAAALGRIGHKARPAVPALLERFKDEDNEVCRAAAMALGRIGSGLDLIGALANPDTRVRRWAAFAVRDMRGVLGAGALSMLLDMERSRGTAKASIPALIEALRDKNEEVRAEVISALGAIGPAAKEAAPKITAALKDSNKLVRLAAASALWRIDHRAEVAVPVLVERLQDKSMDLLDRKSCVEVLGEIGPQAKEAVPALIGLLQGVGKWILTETNVALSFDAAEALGRIGEPAVPALIVVLRDKNLNIRKNAVWALYKMGPKAKAAVPALSETSKDANVQLRLFAIGALRSIGPDARGAVPALIERLTDSDGNVRQSAGVALGSIGAAAKDAVPALIATLKDKDKLARASAAWALGRIGPQAKASIPALIEQLKTDREDDVAAEALGRFGPEAKTAVPTLEALLEKRPDSDEDRLASHRVARVKAALALWRITGRETKALAVLTAALADEDRAARLDAADALGEMGPKAKAAVPALLALMKNPIDSDPFLDRQAAHQALLKIDPQAAKKRAAGK